jgi:hypothetical protein
MLGPKVGKSKKKVGTPSITKPLFLLVDPQYPTQHHSLRSHSNLERRSTKQKQKKYGTVRSDRDGI